jgi:D-alanyl-D-alanine carboxypeptidase
MGGRSAAGRDRIMANLITDHIAEASTGHTATAVADASPVEPAAEPVVTPPTRARPAMITEVKFERISAAARAANAAGEGDDGTGDEETASPQPMLKAPESAPRAAQPTAADLGMLKSPAKPSKKIQARLAAASTLVMPPLGRSETSADDERRPGRASQQDEDSDGLGQRGWMIQIGAPDNLAKANALLSRARERNLSMLAAAKPVTEKVRKGDATLYRARFAGLDSASAEAACRSLKRTGFSCFTAHD